MSTHPARLLGATLLALCALAACKREETPPPKPAVAEAPAAPARTRDQAIAELMALPELKAWSEEIEKRSHGKVHGAVIEDDPTPRIIEGKPYYQLSFVENRKQNVHRRASFLVAKTGSDILVEDAETDTVQSLDEWRRNIQRVELK
ncbi:hypothetical protein ACFQ09_13660 [Massilia norwichensis]|uniref:Lipoprotein n=1 Tax=Massilia norwichensis TaxID=1442366 RepID=A0ABT2A6K0_9BURK|nr:hypothetical protein [Massilia norwichensis]MCS0589779.1 hypothetical protein [Massilia norwichensis]